MPSRNSLESELALGAEAALIVNEAGVVVFATEQACRVLRYGPGELDGQSIELVIPERFRLAHIGQRLHFADHRHRRPMGSGLVLFALCKDGVEQRVDVSLNPIQCGLETLTVTRISAVTPS